MLADTEDTRQGIHLVAIASAQATGLDGRSSPAKRGDTAHSARQLRLPLRHRDARMHPHNALGVGELEDHVGHQVHLDSRPARVAWLTSAPICSASSQPAPECGQFCRAASPTVVEQHGLQARQVIFKTFFTVGLKKNSASARRGRTTFSLPEISAADLSIRCWQRR